MADEKRLIDANEFIEHWNKEYRHLYPCDMYKVAIANFPTVDAVEVVRCKDCHRCGVYTSGKLYCKHQDGLTDPKPDDFCSYGERRY